MKKVSIIIPVYNSKTTIEKCLESIISQTYKNIEIIVIDDGSTDGTKELLKVKYLNKDKIFIYEQKNQGVSAARNLGIKHSSGDYIFFIDSDDTIDKNAILNLIKHSNNKGLISLSNCICKENKKRMCKYTNCKYESDELIKEILKGNILGVVWGYLFDGKIIRDISFSIETSYLEDTLFLIEYLKRSKVEKIIFIDGDNYYNYYLNLNSITYSNNNILNKCNNFIYSLDEINKITNYKYNGFVESKKISLLEKEMRLCKNINKYKKIYNHIGTIKCSIITKQTLLFKYLYNSKKFFCLKLYYFIRKCIKKVKQVII